MCNISYCNLFDVSYCYLFNVSYCYLFNVSYFFKIYLVCSNVSCLTRTTAIYSVCDNRSELLLSIRKVLMDVSYCYLFGMC